MKDEHKTKEQLINELKAETKRKRAEGAQDKESDCLRILVVDDDPTALDFYQEVLCSTINLQGSKSTTGDLEAKLFGNRSSKASIPSFNVTLRHQGDKAVETVRAAIGENKPFAVVFLDVRLPPGPDGVWTAERIRALDPYVQIIMVTGYSDVNPLELACQVPPVDRLFYVQKPLDPQEVRQFASALGAKWHVEKRLRKIHAELEDQVKERTAELAKANEELRIEIAERKRAEEELRKAHDQLEIRVKERTAELAKANEELRIEIAERKRAEEELRESEEKYKTVTESSLTGVFIHQDGKFVFVNNKFAEIHGYTPEELLGKEYFTLIHPDERRVLRQIASKRLKGKAAPQRYEVRRLRKDRETIWCEMMATCIEYRGRPAIMGNIIDITKRKRAEEALRESKAKLAGIVGAVTDHISIIDKQHNIVWANHVAKRLFGPDLVGKKCYAAYHGRYKVCKPCIVKKSFVDGKSHEHETEVIGVDGRKMNFWCTCNVAAWYPDGRPKLVIEISRDITERKRAEEALRESEKKYRQLADLLPQSVFETDKKGNLTFLNRYAFESLGYTQEDFDKGLNVLQVHVPEDRDKVRKNIRRRLSGEELGSTEYTALRKDGSTFPVIIYSSPIIHKNKPVGLRGIVLDITERKRAEEALRESEEKLRFLSSHLLTAQERERRRVSIELHDELGQALTVLKLKLRSIKRKLGTDQTGIKQDCENTLHYIDQVVENVRRLSRDLSPSILDDLGLSAALRWLIHDFTKYYNIKTSLDMEDISNLFSGEAQIMIYRIFQESLTNIGKHAQATSVSIVVKREDSSVSFLVEDDGKGFDVKQVLARHSTERGLGLAAMDERARMLGGSINIWSQEGKGSRITFTIPMYEGGNL